MAGIEVTFTSGQRYWNPATDSVRFSGFLEGKEIKFDVSAEALDHLGDSEATPSGAIAEAIFDEFEGVILAAAHGVFVRSSQEADVYVVQEVHVQNLTG